MTDLKGHFLPFTYLSGLFSQSDASCQVTVLIYKLEVLCIDTLKRAFQNFCLSFHMQELKVRARSTFGLSVKT